MKRIMITLFSVAALCSCGGEKKTPAINTANFDDNYPLQDDFYELITASKTSNGEGFIWQKQLGARVAR